MSETLATGTRTAPPIELAELDESLDVEMLDQMFDEIGQGE